MFNKKAGLQLTAAFLIGFVIFAISFMTIGSLYGNIWNNYGDNIDKGYACLGTLKAQQYTSHTEDIKYLPKLQFQLFTNKCSTINEIYRIEKENVEKPRDELSNQQKAGLKKIADRMAYVWWMTGAGTVENLWSKTNNEDGILSLSYGSHPSKITNKCVTFMNFKIEDSKYFPHPTLDASTGNTVHYLNSVALTEFLKTEEYRPIVKDGQSQIMTYYQYLTLAGGVDSGTILILPTEYKVDETYSISLMKMPENANGFFEIFAAGCGALVGAPLVAYASLEIGTSLAPWTWGVSFILGAAVAGTALYTMKDSAGVCFGSANRAVDDYYTSKESYIEVQNKFKDYLNDQPFFKEITDKDLEKLQHLNLIIIGPQNLVNMMGCKDIRLGSEANT